jgi:hypothetical protein
VEASGERVMRSDASVIGCLMLQEVVLSAEERFDTKAAENGEVAENTERERRDQRTEIRDQKKKRAR